VAQKENDCVNALVCRGHQHTRDTTVSVTITLSNSDLPVELLPSGIGRFTASKLSLGGLGGILLMRAMMAKIKISILKGSKYLVYARGCRRLIYKQGTSKVYKCIDGRSQEFT
jgi:hypothetical protein